VGGALATVAADPGDPGRGVAIVHGVNEIFAAFAVRQVGRQAKRLIG
jgi:hypothetical protein